VVELIFTGVFNDLSPEQCCALLSCLTFDDKKKGDDEESLKGVKSHLTIPYHKLKEVARTVVRVEISCGISVNEDEFVDKLNPGMYVRERSRAGFRSVSGCRRDYSFLPPPFAAVGAAALYCTGARGAEGAALPSLDAEEHLSDHTL
jgi:DSHCT (NUC185) domain